MDFENSVCDFDLNLLAPPPKKTLVQNRLLKKTSVSFLKTKIILSKQVLHRCKALELKLDNTEQDLQNTQESLNKVCNEYKVCLEQHTELENKIEALQNENHLIAERCFNAETQNGGLQSHIKQLQVLITEYETEIKDLKSELKAKKDATPPVRKDKDWAVLNKENVRLKKHIGSLIDVIQKKKKVNKSIQHILDKYRGPKSDDSKTLEHEGDDDFEDVPIFYSEDSCETVVVPPTPNITTSAVSNNAINRINSVETETIDGRSVDTGRGSSLAFSDGEKSFHSPEYYIGDSPLSSETVQNNENAKSYKDRSTSPMFKIPKCKDNFTSPMPRNAGCRDCSSSPIPVQRKSIGTSPIIFQRNNVYIVHDPAEKVERGVSPIKIVECWSSRKNKGVKEIRHVAVDTKSLGVDFNNRHTIRECLERNNSVILSEDSQNDPEVEMILSEMRLHQQLITPIPPTPVVNKINHRVGNNRVEESSFNITGPDDVSILSRKLDTLYDFMFSLKECLPPLLNASADVNSSRKVSPPIINEKVPNDLVENSDLMIVEDSFEFEIGSSNKNVTNDNSGTLTNVFTLNQANRRLDTIEEESDNDLIINEDIDTDNTQQTEIQCDRISPEPIKELNNPESFEKPTKPLKNIRKVKRKVTCLDKMRMRFIPKSKIKQQHPAKKLRIKPKILPVPKTVTEKDTAASLNDKDVYEKAVRVMTELKTKNFKKIPTVVIEDCSKTINTILLSPKKDICNKNNNTNSKVQCSPKSTVKNSSEHTDKEEKSNDSVDLVSNGRNRRFERLSFSDKLSPEKNKNGSANSEVHSIPQSNAAEPSENNDKAQISNNSASLLSNQRRRSKRLSRELLSPDKENNTKNGNTNSNVHSSPQSNTAISSQNKDKAQNSNHSAGLVSNESIRSKHPSCEIKSPKNNTEVQDMEERKSSGNKNGSANSEVHSIPQSNAAESSENNDKAQTSNNSASLLSNQRRRSKRLSRELLSPDKEINTKNGNTNSKVHSSQQSNTAISSQNKDKAQNSNHSADLVSNESIRSKRPSCEIISPKNNTEVQDMEERKLSGNKVQTSKHSANLVFNERRNSGKCGSVSETEPIERNRVLRSIMKSNVSLTDVTSPTLEHNNLVERICNSGSADTSELSTTPVKRRRLRSRQSSGESIKSNSSRDKTTPTKRSSTSLEPNVSSPSQRILRSSIRHENEVDIRASAVTTNTVSHVVNKNSEIDYKCYTPLKRKSRVSSGGSYKRKKSSEDNVEITTSINSNIGQINYGDLDIFSAETDKREELVRKSNTNKTEQLNNPKESILCSMIEKYGIKGVKFNRKPSEEVTNKICEQLEKDIDHIIKLKAHERNNAMIRLVTQIQLMDVREFISGFVKYLKDPNRKAELCSITVYHPAPPITLSEEVLIFIIAELRDHWRGVDLVKEILNNIEYALFNLTRSPDFTMIESMAHFYAIVCRYYQMMSRLRYFVLDSLYCLQFKAVPLIKQCLDVWMHILPLAHMGIAKIPLVTCLVYLLHFYKCEDKFNRVHELRTILKRKFSYNITEWNETKILDMLRTCVKDLRGRDEAKMLRFTLIIVGKRQGPKWCLKNFIKGLLEPMLDSDETPHHIKLFSIYMLGALMKPFPLDMKAHCEVVVNKLRDILDRQPPQDMAEIILTTLIHFIKHNEKMVDTYLLKWNPPKTSFEFEQVLQDHVKSKPVRVWKKFLRSLSHYNSL